MLGWEDRRTVALAVGASLTMLRGLGCGGGETPPATGLSSLVEPLAQESCRRLEACCDEQGFAFAGGRCLDGLRSSWNRELRTLEALRVEVDPEQVVRCREELATAAGCTPEGESCTRVVDGVRAVGESCDFDVECRGGVGFETRCASGVCVRRAALGEPCEETIECAGSPAEVSCLQSFLDQPGVCRSLRPPGEGEPCCLPRGPCFPGNPSQPAVVFDGNRCQAEDGLYCDAGSLTCVRVLDLGEACPAEGSCGTAGWCRRGVCVPPGEEGDDCGKCRGGLLCVTDPVRVGPDPLEPQGTCQPPLPEGAACTYGPHLCEGRCDFDAGRCVPSFFELTCAEGRYADGS